MSLPIHWRILNLSIFTPISMAFRIRKYPFPATTFVSIVTHQKHHVWHKKKVLTPLQTYMSPENHWLEDVFPYWKKYMWVFQGVLFYISPKKITGTSPFFGKSKNPYPNWASPARQSASSSKVVPGSWIGKLILEAKKILQAVCRCRRNW